MSELFYFDNKSCVAKDFPCKVFAFREFASYENQLGVKWSQQKMDWDFWNAVLFAGTICTTIGYGHIYPMTDAGRLLTMCFALFG